MRAGKSKFFEYLKRICCAEKRPFVWYDESEGHVRGRVVFRPFHLGGNGAAHGGTLPLLFDDVLGRLANSVGGRVAVAAIGGMLAGSFFPPRSTVNSAKANLL